MVKRKKKPDYTTRHYKTRKAAQAGASKLRKKYSKVIIRKAPKRGGYNVTGGKKGKLYKHKIGPW